VKSSGSAIPFAVVPERPQADRAAGGADCTEFVVAEEAGIVQQPRAGVRTDHRCGYPSQTASVVARPACATPMTMPKAFISATTSAPRALNPGLHRPERTARLKSLAVP